MARYWICENQECPEFDGQIFSSEEKLAICPKCEQELRPLDDDFDFESEEGLILQRLEDPYLARGLVAALSRDDEREARIFEAEIRRRHGARIKPLDWAEGEMTSGKRVYGLTKPEGGWGGGVNARRMYKGERRKRGKKRRGP